jgi:LacI family transcriptional regulator
MSVTVYDIARITEVSIGTVDRALHARKGINVETRERILRTARELGYKPNLGARALAVGRAPLCIGVCIPREIHSFWNQVRRGILDEVRRFETFGVRIIYRSFPRLGMGEFEEVRELLDSGIRALILAAGDPAGLAPLIEEAEKRRIRVLCVHSDAPGTPRSTVICVNPELTGQCAAELMAKLLPPNSRVAMSTGMLHVEAHRMKINGFCDAFTRFCKGGKVIEVIQDHEDQEEARRKCKSLLERFPAINGFYVSTANCLPICEELHAVGLSGKVTLITTDLSRQMVPYINDGTISASIYQRPHAQGQVAVRLAVDELLSGLPLPHSYYLAPQIVLQSNLGLFREISLTKLTERSAPGKQTPNSTTVVSAT